MVYPCPFKVIGNRENSKTEKEVILSEMVLLFRALILISLRFMEKLF